MPVVFIYSIDQYCIVKYRNMHFCTQHNLTILTKIRQIAFGMNTRLIYTNVGSFKKYETSIFSQYHYIKQRNIQRTILTIRRSQSYVPL